MRSEASRLKCEGTRAFRKSKWCAGWVVWYLKGGELLLLCGGHELMQSRPRQSPLVIGQQTMTGGDRYICLNANKESIWEGGMHVCAKTKWWHSPLVDMYVVLWDVQSETRRRCH